MPAMHGGDIYRNKIEYDFSININPVGVSEEIKTAINNITELCGYYPDPDCEELKGKIAEEFNVKPNNIVCGNGASELIMAIVQAIRPEKALIPIPTFSGFERALLATRSTVKFYHLKKEEDFNLDGEIYWEIENGYDMMFLSNPANPTGAQINPELLMRIIDKCEETKTWLLMDNSSVEFIQENFDMKELIETHKHLIILRSFTKYYGIPGVRLGYAICGDMRLLMRTKLCLPEWNVSVFAQRAGVAALESKSFYEGSRELVKTEREYLKTELYQIFEKANVDLKIFKSDANYLLLKTDIKLYDLLLKKGILIRNCGNYRSLGRGYFRIAVNSHDKNEILINAIREIIDECVVS